MSNQKKLAIIATKGTLDFAYPPLILATTAAALDYEVTIFWTFYGLQVVKKVRDLKISPLGNPGMPMPVPMPVLVQILPGMEAMATVMMKQKMAGKGVASIDTLLEMALESDVKMIACQMTVDLFDFKHEELIDGLEYAGAARFFEIAQDADITLFI
ncbi:MAG: DsrE/DsrF/DrsH-like family protein [Magnetococcales bacterium]|nr:DsrE/DsrF/DrsH-like family protein [Magnetococcales bacterium]MBF0150242.1 DsrE/DsrF/DrsH-like family protein [Magnetococcales bacterium]MBF0172784.1 DsrE/DsrF/DrsH-like family protein [Magnetococcales bacterium]MBF0347748.1 DsrE/DsrF/DrsH-like family protein [Magnetococcales bacterium]MBF0630025.1 DsrE/DsrF/DrsH-like family protein [Magnetococcales bacterium]